MTEEIEKIMSVRSNVAAAVLAFASVIVPALPAQATTSGISATGAERATELVGATTVAESSTSLIARNRTPNYTSRGYWYWEECEKARRIGAANGWNVTWYCYQIGQWWHYDFW